MAGAQRVLEVQARLLGRHLLGEIDGYPPFRTRMARSAYLVCDIADDRRRTSVYEVCRAYGERVQYFRCHIDRSELLVMQAALRTKTHHDEDQMLFVDLGPVEGHGAHLRVGPRQAVRTARRRPP